MGIVWYVRTFLRYINLCWNLQGHVQKMQNLGNKKGNNENFFSDKCQISLIKKEGLKETYGKYSVGF